MVKAQLIDPIRIMPDELGPLPAGVRSDATSFEALLELTPDGFLAKSGPSETLICDAVTVASTTFAEIVTRWAGFFGVDLAEGSDRMQQIGNEVLAGLPTPTASF